MTKPVAIADGAVFDLAAADREMRSEPAYELDGHTARTLVREPAIPPELPHDVEALGDSAFLLTLGRGEHR